METIYKVKKQDQVETLIITRISAGDCRVHILRDGKPCNWGVTVGRKFLSIAKAAEYLREKGWTAFHEKEKVNG